ncbi:tetratricopeptide repeat protein, partial [Corynebacterium callunae]|uniref:tetratricopeptide repeat protein n=1 Tax=Corynebacterium callunae TaxID=1721 RepID=UPI0039827C8F
FIVVQNGVVGHDHPETLYARKDLAFYLGTVGRFREAIALFDALLSDQIRVYGKNHPSTQNVLINFVYCLDRVGLFEQVITHLEALLAVQTQSLGYDHPNTRAIRDKLELLRRQTGVSTD